MGQKQRKRGRETGEKHGVSLADQLDEDKVSEKRAASFAERPEKTRKRQEDSDFVAEGLSKKILKEARAQQQEVENERDEATGVTAARQAFDAVLEQRRTASDSEGDDEDEEEGGFSDTESQFEAGMDVSEEEERAMAAFMARDSAPQKTLADAIMARIREKEQEMGISNADEEGRHVPALDEKVQEVYRGVGQLLRRYTAGKLPKALKVVPALSNWEEVLYLTEPESWSPTAMFQATRLFASNLNAKMAQRFYNLVLLPRVREDIVKHKRLHFALYQALKKAVYKPAAFFKGILLPLCQSGTCSLREAVIIGSVLQKVSIPVLHSSVALLKIAEMEYAGTNSYFIKLLLDKKYALPYRVLDSVSGHFLRFMSDERDLPVIWHLSLLTFVQRYKHDLSDEDKAGLRKLMGHHKHYLVTPEIQRELAHSRARGQKEDPAAMPIGVREGGAKKDTMEEDIFDMPEVQIGMEED